MGFWAKAKGVFGKIGRGIKKYVFKPTLSVASMAATPVGAAIGSLIPGVGTAIGGAIGGGVSALSGALNKVIQ